ncbi:hypothetical protein RHMOL_Rhmol05G0174500 [Rhododendron molle]|uniref:Uncharacterized protein n=2 Tax=Rhododendron molle TaxID=49168 RepID=A0ACC0NRD0_RHOML|nr:hypothetical protein RHMOL_Rhmol05G0174500 [Rhododendron molle]KAI8555439.1 hypothetical protein RHMOL_Rhmol05G0174500 [Rhododendron molle]
MQKSSMWSSLVIFLSAHYVHGDWKETNEGKVYEDNGQMQDKHLLQLLSGIIQWVSPPDAIANAIECGKSESEMLDCCRALLAIATVTTPLVFDQLLKSISPFGTLSLLSALMCEVVEVLMANFTVEET